MRSLLKRLENRRIRTERKGEELARIWDLAAHEPGAPPPVDLEWAKLERRIEMAEAKAKAQKRSAALPLWFPKPVFAAAFSVVLILSGLWLWQANQDVYKAGRMQTQTIVLGDGSHIQLNCDSRLKVLRGFGKRNRQVFLKGEAYFKVAKGKTPFQVITGQGDVTVVGTEFNVLSRKEKMEVAVNEGIVAVGSGSTKNRPPVTLTQGQMTQVFSGSAPDSVKPIQFDQYPGWLHGTLTVYQTELIDLVEEVQRRFNVRVEIQDPDIRQIEITGLFDATFAEPVLESVCVLLNKEMVVAKDRFVIQ